MQCESFRPFRVYINNVQLIDWLQIDCFISHSCMNEVELNSSYRLVQGLDLSRPVFDWVYAVFGDGNGSQ
jgi:hypothetical protein